MSITVAHRQAVVATDPIHAVAPASGPARTTRHRSRLALVQFVGAAVDGLVLASIVVHAVLGLGLGATAVGWILAGAAGAALLTAPWTGALADRLGLRRAAAGFSVLTALALVGYALTGALTGSAASLAFTGAAVLFVTAQAASGSARQALAVVGASESERLGIRATMHTLLNAGLGLGSVLGALLIATDSAALFTIGYLVAAAVSLVVAAATVTLPSAGSAPTVPAGSRPAAHALIALRDRRFALATGLATLVQLTMPILSVLLPVWVLRQHGPAWVAGVALALNTVLVIVAQRWWAGLLTDALRTARSALVAAAALALAGGLLALTPADGTTTVALVVIGAAVVLTVGEIGGGAAVWSVALARVPAEAEGRYQAAFSMSASGARILGPLVALPLVLQTGALGWLLLTSVMAAACAGVAVLAHDRTDR